MPLSATQAWPSVKMGGSFSFVFFDIIESKFSFLLRTGQLKFRQGTTQANNEFGVL